MSLIENDETTFTSRKKGDWNVLWQGKENLGKYWRSLEISILGCLYQMRA